MKPTVKKILQKFSTQKVELSQIDELQDVLPNISYGLEASEEKLDEALKFYIEAKDILKFDTNNYILDAEDILDKLKKSIDDLGIDVPSNVSKMESELDKYKKEYDKLERKLNDF